MSETLTLAIAFLWMRTLACIHRNVCVQKETKIQRHNLADTERANGLIWAVCDAKRMLVIIVLGASKWQISHTQTRVHTHTHTGWSVGRFEIKAFITSDCPFIRRNRKWPRYRCSLVSQLLDAASLWTSSSLILWSKDVCAWEAGESKDATSQCETAQYSRGIVEFALTEIEMNTGQGPNTVQT